MYRHDPLHSTGTRVPGVPGKLLILIPVTVSREIRGLILNFHQIHRTFSQNRKAPAPKKIAKSGKSPSPLLGDFTVETLV